MDEYILCYKSLVDLFGIFHQNGLITDKHFKRLGFLADRDAMGRTVHRAAGISQENFLQYKCLTHPAQKSLRDDCLVKIAATIIAKKLKTKRTRAHAEPGPSADQQAAE